MVPLSKLRPEDTQSFAVPKFKGIDLPVPPPPSVTTNPFDNPFDDDDFDDFVEAAPV